MSTVYEADCGLSWAERLSFALAHRWEPERLIVIFTAYFDEADTHGPSPTVIVAAHVGHAYQWRRFEKKLSRIQEQHGFKIFHAKDFKGRQREFAGWTEDKRKALLDDLATLVTETLTEGLAAFLERERYLKEYRSPPIPKKMNLDSQYGACFRACLGRLLQLLEERKNRDQLNVVFERGHPNVWDCERIFNDLKARYRRLNLHIFGSFTVETKETCPPLMVADLLAAVYSRMRELKSKGELDAAAFVVDKAPDKGRIAFIELGPNALSDLKTRFEEARRADVEEWRRQKAIRKASSSEKEQPS